MSSQIHDSYWGVTPRVYGVYPGLLHGAIFDFRFRAISGPGSKPDVENGPDNAVARDELYMSSKFHTNPITYLGDDRFAHIKILLFCI